jgi:ribosomal protein S18 acetylase RimI-like enzyme
MYVRTLTEQDLDAYWHLRLRALRDNPEAFGSTYEETLVRGKESMLGRLSSAGDSFTLGSFDDMDDLIGTVRFFREEGTKQHHRGYVFGMNVTPEARGQGVGKALMRQLIAQARALDGLEQLHLGVVTINATAYNLYQSLGFEVYGTAPKALKLGDQYWDEHSMILLLR